MVKIITASEFDTMDKKGVILLDFYADWCGPCQQLLPILEELSNEMEEVTIVKMNVDEAENKKMAMKHKVMSIPTMLLYSDGELKATSGFLPKDELITFINTNK